MDFWTNLVIFLHVGIAVTIIGLVLLQHGKGAEMGSGFGSGGSGSLFGATGSANFLSRTTGVLAAVFFASSLGLGYFAMHKPKAGGSVVDAVKGEQPSAAKPAAKVPDAPKAAVPGDVPAPKEDAKAGKGEAKAKDVPN